MRVNKYWIRIPNVKYGRTEFRIYKNGKVFDNDRLKAINLALRSTHISYNEALEGIRKLISDIKASEAPDRPFEYSHENSQALTIALKAYADRRKISPRTRIMATAGVRRAARILGAVSIYSVSLDQLYALIDKQHERSQPKVALFLNQLLKAAGRTERLKLPSAPDLEVKYLTPTEFMSVVDQLNPHHAPVVVAAYATGARLGEVFALSRIGRKQSIYIERQMFHLEVAGAWYGLPKWGRKRWAPICTFGLPWVSVWTEELGSMPEESKRQLRRLDWGHLVTEACKLAFPNNKSKHLTFRDVRHCYAIYWLDRGASCHHVAQAMGNSERVVRKHYAGFIQTDEAETTMLSLETEKK